MNRLRIYVDINESLIRTGESSLEQQLTETKLLWQIRQHLLELSNRDYSIDLVLITGNSFEYSRRVEEPLGLKNLANVNLFIISENGLIARGLSNGIGWRLFPTPSYKLSVAQIIEYLDLHWSSSIYLQGNEARLTVKPIDNEFPQATLENICRFISRPDFQQECQIHAHRYYIDIDPKFVSRTSAGENPFTFDGKGWAVRELENKLPRARLLAVGDSKSDFPMYAAIVDQGGVACHVANGAPLSAESETSVIRLQSSFTSGVLESLQYLV